MNKLLLFTLTLLTATLLNNRSFAQSEERRNKVQMVINFGGKAITTDLNSLSMSLSRSADEETSTPHASTDTSKAKIKVPSLLSTSFYLTIDAKQIDTELLKVFSKKQTRFDGVITITDTYGKNAPRVIKFKQASLYNYSDQFSAASYGEAYGSSVISIICKEVTVNGVIIEQ
jgi:hypothetical protein